MNKTLPYISLGMDFCKGLLQLRKCQQELMNEILKIINLLYIKGNACMDTHLIEWGKSLLCIYITELVVCAYVFLKNTKYSKLCNK